jgi:hypothetical protein
VHPDEPEQYRIPPAGYPYPPSGQDPYGPPAGHGPPAGYPQPYGVPGYAPPGHAVPGYAPPGYAPPYGAAPWNAPRPPAAWPHGPGRPGIATAAAVMGFVTGGLTALAGLFSLLAVFGGADLPTGLLALGLPCAGGLIRGGVSLLNRDSERVLVASAVLSVVVLLFALLAGALSYDGDDVLGLSIFVVLAGSLPVVTGALAASRTVKGWLAAPA